MERWVVIPVCYGGEWGPDLEAVAAAHGLSADEVVARHSSAEYQVSAVGFTPGFPYLGGLPESLHTAAAADAAPAGASRFRGHRRRANRHLSFRNPRRLAPHRAHPAAAVQSAAAAAEPAAGGRPRAVPPDQRRKNLAPHATHEPHPRPGPRPCSRPCRTSAGRGGSAMGSRPAARWMRGRCAWRICWSATPRAPPALSSRWPVRPCDSWPSPSSRSAGADFQVTINGRRVPAWRPVRLAAGTDLVLGAARTGCRAYLAIAGGIAVPRVLGGRGTHLAAGFGGLGGRALRAGDVLKNGPASAWARRLAGALAGTGIFSRLPAGRSARRRGRRVPQCRWSRVMRGPQWDWFSAEAQERFWRERFTVTAAVRPAWGCGWRDRVAG